MYPLGKQFEVDIDKAKAKPEQIFQGKKYRITVITERLVRMEYQENGLFIDNPSELALNRSFATPKIEKKEDENILEIDTSYFHLYYVKNQPFKNKVFPRGNLRITLKEDDKTWYYGHPEVRNYLGTVSSLDDIIKNLKLEKGLFSVDGFASLDDSKGLIFTADGVLQKREKKGTDVYLFAYRTDFGLCLGDYFRMTGLPEIPPRYAFGNLWGKDGMKSEREVFNLLNKFKKHKLPLSSIIFSKEWNQHPEITVENDETSYTWNNKIFPKPIEFIKWLHKRDLKVGLQIKPKVGIKTYEPMFEQITKHLATSNNKNIPFAPFSPKFMDVYFKFLLHANEQIGVDFWWIDSIFKEEKMSELFLLNHYHYQDINRGREKRGMIISRNSKVAAHRYPILTSGDLIVGWENFKLLPFFNISAANMGISFLSHDVGGHYGGIEDRELYTRFIQFSTFSPIMRFHAPEGKYYKREPWRWDRKTLEITRDYMQLRHKMIPYLYSESYKYHLTGKTLVQPFYYKYPEYYDDSVYRNQYFFGSEILVAPIITPKDVVMNRVKQEVFLPGGNWYDLVSGKKYPGGRSYVLFFKDEEYPVFAKEGAIIVYGKNKEINNTDVPTTLIIDVFPGRGNTYELYEDDGKTNRYKDGFYLKTKFDKTIDNDTHSFKIKPTEGKGGVIPATRNYEVKFRNTKTPSGIKIYENGVIVKHEFLLDGNDFTVKFNGLETASEVKIEFSGKDLYIDEFRKINEDLDEIIGDLKIRTTLKEKINIIMFGDAEIKRKRIEIRKLKRRGLDKKFINLFLDLLEYVSNI